MQTETESGPLPFEASPAHLLGSLKDPVAAIPAKNFPSMGLSEIPPNTLGAFRGAIYCLPIAVVMWAIIIAAVLHFLIA